MANIKKIGLVTATAAAVVVAFAFAQAKAKIEASAPAVGTVAPNYFLPDQDGQMHTLASDKGKTLLLAFYPADFTGGCTLEAHSLTSAYKDLKALGVTVYGVSVQDPKSHKSFCSKEGIPYTLLADTEKKMATAYGVLIPGVGIANRVTYLIGADGKVAYIDTNVNGHLTTCGEDWVAWVKAHPAAHASTASTLASLNSDASGPATLGKAAPGFTLPDTSTGKLVSLESLAASKKATVLMFVSTRCPVSNAYNSRMAALAKKYTTLGVAFAGIDANTTEPTTEIADFVKQQHFLFPILKDADDKVADAYAAHVTPETFVVDKQGVLVYHGRIDNDMDPANVKTHELSAALDAVLAGKAVTRPEAKAFGCSIKRGE